LNQDGKSTLLWAANNGSADVVTVLVAAKAIINIVNEVSASGMTTGERHSAGGGG